jgi:hypothetical protein
VNGEAGGAGRAATRSERRALEALLGFDAPPPIDLNAITPAEFAKHPLGGRRAASALQRLRRRGAIVAPADLFHAGVIDDRQLRLLSQVAYGTTPQRPMVLDIATKPERIYVDEAFDLIVVFHRRAVARPELVTVDARFPSGRLSHATYAIPERARTAGRLVLPGFASAEAGELRLLITLRDDAGDVHQRAGRFPVLTRNPVRIYLTPTYLTQSGRAGAPRFDFGQRRWYCEAAVRWVNSTSSRVNLGRRITVRLTDAGSHVGTFSFDLSSAIVIPAESTIYGNLYTYHPEGNPSFDVFHAKGDLTFEYSMSGSGFTPTRSQIWRTMRLVGYNLIRVGDFTNTERSEYNRAAREVASGIFISRDMTVYGTELYRIEGTAQMDADKARFRFIDNQGEINELRNRYTVSNWYLDVFMVEGRWDGAFGSSPVNGPVDKQGDSSGLVVRRDGDTMNLGQTFAHEAGHYVGLEHADEDDGCADTDPASPDIDDNFIFSSSRRDSAVITGCQIDKMRRHGLVRSMTP